MLLRAGSLEWPPFLGGSPCMSERKAAALMSAGECRCRAASTAGCVHGAPSAGGWPHLLVRPAFRARGLGRTLSSSCLGPLWRACAARLTLDIRQCAAGQGGCRCGRSSPYPNPDPRVASAGGLLMDRFGERAAFWANLAGCALGLVPTLLSPVQVRSRSSQHAAVHSSSCCRYRRRCARSASWLLVPSWSGIRQAGQACQGQGLPTSAHSSVRGALHPQPQLALCRRSRIEPGMPRPRRQAATACHSRGSVQVPLGRSKPRQAPQSSQPGLRGSTALMVVRPTAMSHSSAPATQGIPPASLQTNAAQQVSQTLLRPKTAGRAQCSAAQRSIPRSKAGQAGAALSSSARMSTPCWSTPPSSAAPSCRRAGPPPGYTECS